MMLSFMAKISMACTLYLSLSLSREIRVFILQLYCEYKAFQAENQGKHDRLTPLFDSISLSWQIIIKDTLAAEQIIRLLCVVKE
jgi:hypothetical protein